MTQSFKFLLSIFLLISLSSCSFNHFDAKAWTATTLSEVRKPPLSTKNVQKTPARDSKTRECVVLIHGLWRSAFAMRSIESFLRENHYLIENISYPSTQGSIQSIANNYLAPAISNCASKSSTVHIVTHSMGGIVAQAYLQDNRLMNNSKIVMLSPPSKGSELAKLYKDNNFIGYFAGQPAMTLHNDDGGIINKHAAFPEMLGVIAGYRNWSLWPEALLPSPNDGMVSLQSMITEGMDDLILINTGHAMMRYSDEVKLQILSFLRHGAFDHRSN